MAKIWKKFDFWMKIKATLATLGAGGEVTLLLNGVSAKWHIITIAATMASILITNFIQDENKDGIVDILETDKKKNESAKKL